MPPRCSWSSTTTRRCSNAPGGAFGENVRVLANAHRQGLSGARNTAVAAASGDVVVFLDDDAAARPGWLRALLAPVRRPRRGRGGRGGPPALFPGARPSLLPTGGTGADATGELDWVVGCTYTGQPTEQAEVRNLMGCNMSLRREVFARVGGFAEDLGRIGRNPLGCEETELCIRIRQSYRRMGREARIVFEPARAGRPPGERGPRPVGVPAAAQLVGGLVEGGGVAARGQ